MEDERPHDYIDFRIENTVASLEMDEETSRMRTRN